MLVLVYDLYLKQKGSLFINDVLDVELQIADIREHMGTYVECCLLMSLLPLVNTFSKCLFTSHGYSNTTSSYHGPSSNFLFILRTYSLPSNSRVLQSNCRASKMSQKPARRPLGPNPVPENNIQEIHSADLMKGNRVADLRTEASASPLPRTARPDSKRGQKATIKSQQEVITTQTRQIEILTKTNIEQNATIESHAECVDSHNDVIDDLENRIDLFNESNEAREKIIESHLRYIEFLENNDARFGYLFDENTAEGRRLIDKATEKLHTDHKDRLDRLFKEQNAQFVAQSRVGIDQLLQERRAQLPEEEEHDCSKFRAVIETQIMCLQQKIADFETKKELKERCPNEDKIDQLVQERLHRLKENHDAELRSAYEAAFEAIAEDRRKEDKDTIARLLSTNADLEANIERNSRTTNELREQLNVIKGHHEHMAARLQEKMEKLDAALGRLKAAEDEETKKPGALVDSEYEIATEKRTEGGCIMS